MFYAFKCKTFSISNIVFFFVIIKNNYSWLYFSKVLNTWKWYEDEKNIFLKKKKYTKTNKTLISANKVKDNDKVSLFGRTGFRQINYLHI